MLKIEQVSVSESSLIHELAKQVWEPTYGAILEREQLDYMFNMMYSVPSIEEQMLTKQHVYFIAWVEGDPVGYFSMEKQADTLFHLHKIYVVPHMQGNGIGNFLLQRAVVYARDNSQGEEFALKLHVNRHNKKALAFYLRMGFEQVGEADFDIGNNYYMNDYILQLSCERNPNAHKSDMSESGQL